MFMARLIRVGSHWPHGARQDVHTSQPDCRTRSRPRCLEHRSCIMLQMEEDHQHGTGCADGRSEKNCWFYIRSHRNNSDLAGLHESAKLMWARVNVRGVGACVPAVRAARAASDASSLWNPDRLVVVPFRHEDLLLDVGASEGRSRAGSRVLAASCTGLLLQNTGNWGQKATSAMTGLPKT